MIPLPRHADADYDHAIVGAGAAGLSLAVHLVRAFEHARVLLVDPGFGDVANRTFAFWSDTPPPLPEAVERSWSRLRLLADDGAVECALDRHRYHVIGGAGFRDACLSELAASGRAFLHLGRAESIDEARGGVRVRGPGLDAHAGWAFDSRLEDLPKIDVGHVALTQRFLGWEIVTEADAFDPEVVTLFDFRTEPGEGDVRFVYVLPFDARRALVEHVALHEHDARAALHTYVRDTLGIERYTVARVESGESPLTDAPFARRAGARCLRIGIAGGRLKPSSGYAFVRIWDDCEAIVRSLCDEGHPFALPDDRAAFRFLDGLLLRVMRGRPEVMSRLFLQMFERNGADRVLAFLDERVGAAEVLALGTSLPVGPFAEQLGELLGESLRGLARRMSAPPPYEG